MRTTLLMLSLSMVLTSCLQMLDPHDDEHDDHHNDDHSAVTTVTLQLIEHGTSDTTRVVWEDLDGVGGNNPNRIDTLTLKPGKTYIGSIRFENSTNAQTVDLTSEVRQESDEHQVFYAVSDSLGRVTVVDQDERGLPIGLSYLFDTAQTPSEKGSLTVSLYHYATQSSKNGTDPASETDVEVTFPLVLR